MELYVSEITVSEQSKRLEPYFIGETFNNNAVLIKEEIAVRYYKAGENVCLTIAGEFEVESSCDRCTDAIAVTVDFSEQYVVFPRPGNEDLEYTYTDNTIDLAPYVHESIVLNIPVKMLCDEECLGVCPACGKNRNRETCTCVFDN